MNKENESISLSSSCIDKSIESHRIIERMDRNDLSHCVCVFDHRFPCICPEKLEIELIFVHWVSMEPNIWLMGSFKLILKIMEKWPLNLAWHEVQIFIQLPNANTFYYYCYISISIIFSSGRSCFFVELCFFLLLINAIFDFFLPLFSDNVKMELCGRMAVVTSMERSVFSILKCTRTQFQ